jgi:O-antigen/teichoic acid export membrane protein
MPSRSLASHNGITSDSAGAVRAGTPKLRVSVLSALFGQGFFAACQWGMLIVLAKLGTASAVGEYALALAITAPVQLFCDLALRTLQATDSGHKYSFRDYLGLRFLSTSLALLCTVAILAITHYETRVRLVVFAIALLKALESVGDIFYGLFQQSEKMNLVSMSLTLRGVTYIAALYLALRFSGSLSLACFSLVLARALILIFHDSVRGLGIMRSNIATGGEASIRPRWDRAALRGLFLAGLPSGAAIGVMSFNTNVPRYLLNHFMGMSSLGIFAAYSNLILTLSIVVDAAGQAVVPRLAFHYLRNEQAQFRRLLGLIISFAVILAVAQLTIVFLCGEDIVRLFYRQSFVNYPATFRALAFAAVFLYSNALLGYALMAVEAFRSILAGQLVSTVVVVAGSVLLIPRLGITGAALALVASSVACSLTYLAGLRRRVPAPVLLPGPGNLSQLLSSFLSLRKTSSNK